MGKGEIARYEQFLLFPQCFQKTCTFFFWGGGERSFANAKTNLHYSKILSFAEKLNERGHNSSQLQLLLSTIDSESSTLLSGK